MTILHLTREVVFILFPILKISPSKEVEWENPMFAMQEGGFNSDPFDWIVCNAGGDIWHALNKSQDGEAYWEADEQWEHHIEHRWV